MHNFDGLSGMRRDCMNYALDDEVAGIEDE
jgi:hypothetical protein